jgi:hypothetical protein
VRVAARVSFFEVRVEILSRRGINILTLHLVILQ